MRWRPRRSSRAPWPAWRWPPTAPTRRRRPGCGRWPRGEKRGTVALFDAGSAAVIGEFELEAKADGDDIVLDGEKVLVLDAGSADFFLVAHRDGRRHVVERDADGVTVTPEPSIDLTRRLYSVRLDGVRVARRRDPERRAARLPAGPLRGCVAIAAESTGIAQRTLEMAVEYAKDRQQFGRPIGSYQAVSHRCAQMLLETENSRSAVYGAAWAADADPDSLPLAASMAKAYASDAGWRVPDASIQVHGGIGFTWEHDLHFFLKRGKANAATFGDAKWHRERVAELVLAARRRAGRRLSVVGRELLLDRISVAAIGTTVADLEAEAKRAEAAGVECVWAPELFRSAVTQASYLAGRTETIGIATGIVWAFTRSPFILAVSALDVDEMSGGRFRLGLGSGVKRLNETWHNAEYGKPAPHLREAIEATRLIMQQAGRGEPIRYEGSYYDIDIKGWVRPHPAPRESVPIYTAGVQGGMCRMAGDVADGLIGHPIQSLRWIDEVVVSSFEEGLKRSGRDRGDFDYLPTVCCAIDDDEAKAIEMARRTISFYATVKTYMPLWELHGFADNAAEAGEAFRRGDLAAVPAAISDEMVDTYCAAGPLDKVRARVEETAERADGLFLTPPTYFISPEELSEYQNRLIDAFGPAEVSDAVAGEDPRGGGPAPGAGDPGGLRHDLRRRFAGIAALRRRGPVRGRRARAAVVAGGEGRRLAREGRPPAPPAGRGGRSVQRRARRDGSRPPSVLIQRPDPLALCCTRDGHAELGRRPEDQLAAPDCRFGKVGEEGLGRDQARLWVPFRPCGDLHRTAHQRVDAAPAGPRLRRRLVMGRPPHRVDRGLVQPAQPAPVLDQVPVLIARPGVEGQFAQPEAGRLGLELGVESALRLLVPRPVGPLSRSVPEEVGEHRSRPTPREA